MWKKEISFLCTTQILLYQSCKRPIDGLLLEPKHVAVNKLIKLVLCASDLIHILVIR